MTRNRLAENILSSMAVIPTLTVATKQQQAQCLTEPTAQTCAQPVVEKPSNLDKIKARSIDPNHDNNMLAPAFTAEFSTNTFAVGLAVGVTQEKLLSLNATDGNQKNSQFLIKKIDLNANLIIF